MSDCWSPRKTLPLKLCLEKWLHRWLQSRLAGQSVQTMDINYHILNYQYVLSIFARKCKSSLRSKRESRPVSVEIIPYRCQKIDSIIWERKRKKYDVSKQSDDVIWRSWEVRRGTQRLCTPAELWTTVNCAIVALKARKPIARIVGEAETVKKYPKVEPLRMQRREKEILNRIVCLMSRNWHSVNRRRTQCPSASFANGHHW